MDCLPESGVPDYAELDCLSNHTFLRGASHPAELVQRAAQLGYRALALCDECSVSGIPEAHREAVRQGLHLIVGSRFRSGPGELLILACDRNGYASLCRLITLARGRESKGSYRFALADILDPPNALASMARLPGCLLVYRPDYDAAPERVLMHVQALARAFDGRLWLGLVAPLYHADARHRRNVRECARILGLAVVALGQAEMHLRSRQHLHDVLAAIRLNTSLADCGHALRPNAEHHLRSRLRLAGLHAGPELQQTLEIRRRCRFSLDDIRYCYPEMAVPPGMTAQDWLRQETLAGARWRYPEGIPEGVATQIAAELALIAELSYEAYFLTVYDIVRFARDRGILCQGRGSAANSAVCYCLGITEVNPETSNTLFSRFISRERNEPPDIDVDFEHHRREEVIQYIYRRYGREHAALTAVRVSYRLRSALRDTGKALALDPLLVARVARACRYRDANESLLARIEEHGGDRGQRSIRLWAELACALVGFPRHLSQHPGGFVISREPLHRLVPVENAAMQARSVVQWDKNDLDALGILKIDILALGMLSALQRCLRLVSQRRGTPLRLQDIPADDAATFEMIRRADTVGVFQIESRAQMSMLPRLKPRNFYDLVIQLAIVRPGPIQGGMVHPYLQRRQNPGGVRYPGKALKPILERTLGVIIFQEQAMQVAMTAAGFTADEADQLRRAMAAWHRHGDIHAFRERMIDGMLANGHDKAFAESLFRQLEGFGEYGFPESHAASFARLAWFSAWLKCHEPAAFLCALLNVQPMGFYSPGQLIQDARRHAVPVLPVDVQCSAVDSTLETDDQGRSGVRLGLGQIRHLPLAASQRIVQARAQGHFENPHDLARRAVLARHEMLLLAKAGVLSRIAATRPLAIWQAANPPLPGLFQALAPAEPVVPALAQLSDHQTVLEDYASMGFSLGHHPLRLLRQTLRARRFETAQVLRQEYPDRRLARACGLVVQRQRPMTARGTVFLTLEDETGNVNIIVRTTLAQRQRSALIDSHLLGVYGRWQRQDGVCHLLADHLVNLNALLPDLPARSRDFH